MWSYMWWYELLKNKTYLFKKNVIHQIIILFWLPLTHQEYEQAQEGRHGAAIQQGQRDEHGRIQGWEFSLSLIHYSLFRSFALRSFAHSLFTLSLKIAQYKKSNREWFALVAKRLSPNCFHRSKSDRERYCSGHSWQKRDWRDLLFFTSESFFCSFTHKKLMSEFPTLITRTRSRTQT